MPPIDPEPDALSLVRPMLRVWRRRCPRCGRGALFQSYFRLRHECADCGLVYRREPGAMTGQMYLSAAVTQLFAGLLVVVIWLGTDFSPRTSVLIGLPIVLLFSYATLPRAMASWVAIEYMTDAVAPDHEDRR